MTRDEQIDLLKGLLARVRASAIARGIELPKDAERDSASSRAVELAELSGLAEPPSAERERSAPHVIELGDADVEPFVDSAPPSAPAEHHNGSGLTAFAETGAGTHAPLALVGAPPSDAGGATLATQAAAALAGPPGLVDDDDDDDDDDLPRTAVSISFANDSPYAQPQAPALEPPPSRQPFDAAFEDEITSNGDPAEIEAAVLASAAPESARIPTPPPTPAPITRVATGVPPAPPTRVATPVPPAPPTRVVPQTTPAPQRMSSLPAAPLTLDDLDLDGLGTPEAAISVPPPRAASYRPPSRISHPPTMPPTATPDISTPPPPAPYIPTPPPPAPYIPTPPPPAPYIPTPPPPSPYIPTPPPPRVPTPTAPAYVVTPPPMMAAADEVELEDSDLVESSPQPAMPDPTATLPGSSASFASAFDPRGSAPDLDAEVPASQRQPRVEDRLLDDALEGIVEPPPESGEVESQRYTRVADQIEQTMEIRALASVDVVDRPSQNMEGVAVASFNGKLASSARPSFGEILDSALDL